ncbi:MAG: tetratricopeptide (TPR) repeat protein [Glaciecola sp.]|jgi:tetratricopeptide (TPR) repeat protein
MKHAILTLLLLVVLTSAYSQTRSTKEISGTITYLNEPLIDVNITIKGTSKGTKTDDKGEYRLQANVGAQIQYSYVGFNNVTILIEDITSILNIEMDNYVTKLDEVIVEGTSKTKKSSPGDEYNRKIKTSHGNLNPMLLPDSRYFSRDRIATQYRTLSDALKFYYPKGIDFIEEFEVDGKIFDFEPHVMTSTIRDIYVATIRSVRYPAPIQIMIIRTTNSEEYREITAEKHRNQNYYDDDAIVSDETETFSSNNLIKTISGKVTNLFAPIPNVNITIKGTSKGTKTDNKGEYNLQANIGDILEYSHVSYTTVAVMIEDVTSTLNIELQEKNNELDEVVLTAKRSPKDLATFEEKMNAEIRTSFGIFKPNASGTKVHYLSGEELGTHYADLGEALKGKFSGKLPNNYDVDGIPYNKTSISVLNLAIIKDVYVTKNVIVVRTMDSPEEIARRQEEKAEQYRNQNYYNADAVSTNDESTFSSSNLTKDISGKVTHLFAPIPNVNITIKGTSKGTKTNDKGEYRLRANVGDILEYSHVAYTTVAVMVEDVTSTLNIELQEKDNKLDEVLVKARKNQKALEFEKKMNVDLRTPFGTFNPKTSGFSIEYIPGESLNQASKNLAGALAGKFAGSRYVGDPPVLLIREKEATYVVDGREDYLASSMNMANIEDVYVVKHKSLVIIRTKMSPEIQDEKRKAVAEQYQNQNYYNADALTTSVETTFSSANITATQPKYIVAKDIHGKVSYLDAPMPLVNISIVGKNSGIVTSPKGTYSIEANVGDIIQYSHVGFATVSIIVEDVTEVLNIEMVEKQNELETVIVTADGKLGKTAELAKKADKTFKTAMGTYDPKTSGNSSAYIDGNDVTSGARDILDVLNGKVAGVTVDRVNMVVKLRSTGSINTDVPAIFDVDGVIVNGIPQIDPANIKDIHLLKSLASTTRYGTAGRGGVIVVTTRSGDFSATEANRNKIADKYTNKDFYANDASQISLSSLNANSYADALEAFPNKQKAFIYYDEKLKNKLPSYADHIAIAQKFVSHFNDLTLSTQIFKELIERNSKNPEVLKAIAFHLQTIGRPKEAIEAYERTFKLRPQYAQSYRDLANAYIDNDQYKKSWRLYMSYLMQGNDVSTEGIGELIYNEMEWLYFSRRNQTEIKEKFVPKSENLFDFRNDVRIVVEWNSSEAEFDLEFVNPELRSYIFEHTLAGNQELITDEKEKGYSSKEFFIDDLKDGEWLVNITYKGNKKPEPTYFKITKFYNWGKPTETKVVSVYKFQNEREKIQLMQFNKELLVASK